MRGGVKSQAAAHTPTVSQNVAMEQVKNPATVHAPIANQWRIGSSAVTQQRTVRTQRQVIAARGNNAGAPACIPATVGAVSSTADVGQVKSLAYVLAPVVFQWWLRGPDAT